jgi:dihydrodipicolinate reductase
MCDLGNAPVYSINVTNPNHVAAGIEFAKENNVRLVIKNTGQDRSRTVRTHPPAY